MSSYQDPYSGTPYVQISDVCFSLCRIKYYIDDLVKTCHDRKDIGNVAYRMAGDEALVETNFHKGMAGGDRVHPELLRKSIADHDRRKRKRGRPFWMDTIDVELGIGFLRGFTASIRDCSLPRSAYYYVTNEAAFVELVRSWYAGVKDPAELLIELRGVVERYDQGRGDQLVLAI